MSEPQSFLEGRVHLHRGDCLDVLRRLADCSIDSVVTDPPYALVSIVKRFGAKGAKPTRAGDVYSRASAGFMGKAWDTGERAFAVEFWAEVLRVLKPGGHLVAFSGTRTYHRMVVAIEDAGFEIRDQIGWLYGSGFPKSHDVSKAIDKRGGKQVAWFGPWLKKWREENGIRQADVAALFPSRSGGKTGCVANWELGLNMPTPEQFNRICAAFNLPFDSLEQAERQVVGQVMGSRLAVAPGQGAEREAVSIEVTEAATAAAAAWQGWGTALKPAWEPIVLARKGLIGTVAENVLEHGTGALNIGECRVGDEVREAAFTSLAPCHGNALGAAGTAEARRGTQGAPKTYVGRWPANVVHDGSDEVVAAFPDSISAGGTVTRRSDYSGLGEKGGAFVQLSGKTWDVPADEGSAARFFYSAKADAHDRVASKHPTVKPVDLMQWLVRLVTPQGGTVLDPFAGTGTTGEAAWREGMNAVLVEREDEYAADIARRMRLAVRPAERAATAKAKGELKTVESLPLFGGGDETTAFPGAEVKA